VICQEALALNAQQQALNILDELDHPDAVKVRGKLRSPDRPQHRPLARRRSYRT